MVGLFRGVCGALEGLASDPLSVFFEHYVRIWTIFTIYITSSVNYL
jgi:hypothetical protein